jgi:hypothetical protein
MTRSLALAALATFAWARAAAAAEPAPRIEGHGPSSSRFPSHRFQLAGRSAERPQVGINFGLLQLALHGFNAAAELRYKRFWFEYSHGQALTLNHQPSLGMTTAERDAGLHMYVPYTTGFGVGVTLIDELWLGAEFKAHRYEVTSPSGDQQRYQTYSIGPVLGYKLFIWRGLHANFYLRYWPNVATSLTDDQVVLAGTNGPIVHHAHEFNVFANVSLGWAFDL